MTATTNAGDPGLACDAIAPEYDKQVSGDAWMRSALWAHLDRVFCPGDRVLDCGCGTGSDAVHLSSRGAKVTAIDISPAMVERTRARALGTGPGSVAAYVMDIGAVGRLSPASFDGIISCFAGLNTQPNLRRFADDAARLLKPGGRAVVHLLNPWSLWEWMSLVSHGDVAAAWTLGTRRKRQFTIGGIPVCHYLERPETVYSTYFEHRFSLLETYALGVFRPPAGSPRLPLSVLAGLGACDLAVGRFRPFRHWGRFTVLDLEVRTVVKPHGPSWRRKTDRAALSIASFDAVA